MARRLRGRIDRLAAGVLQGGSRQFAKAGVIALELPLNLDQVVGGDQTSLANTLEAEAQGLPVTQDFLRGRIDEGLRQNIVPEQLVVGGDDILDLGAILRLLQA